MTQLVFFVFIGILLVGTAGAAGFFFLFETEKPPPPPVQPAPKPVKKPEPPPKKVEEPEPPPKEPEPPRDYSPRSFVGVYMGIYNGEGKGLGAMHFVAQSGEAVLLKAPSGIHELYEPGKTYRFVFKPTDDWFDDRIVSYHSLHSRIEEDG
jgi:hypothetical protein